MGKTVLIKGEEVELRPMTPQAADLFRRLCTEIGLPAYCPFKACRRTRRCATAQVICYQMLREELNAVVLPALRARLDGTPMPEWPQTEEAWDKLLNGRWPAAAAPDKVRPGQV